jgi:hypothetical protein
MAKQRIGLGATFATAANSQANLIQTLEEENERLAAEIAHLKASGVTSAEKEEEHKSNVTAPSLSSSGTSSTPNHQMEVSTPESQQPKLGIP